MENTDSAEQPVSVAHSAVPVGRSTSEYLMLQAEQVMLILPQSSVSNIHHLSDDEIERIHLAQCVLQPDSIRDGKSVWFAALSDELTLLPTLPKSRFLLTTFLDYPDIHWCWRNLYQVNRGDYDYVALPPIICTGTTPVHGLAVLGGQRHAFFTSAKDIVNYIQSGQV